jgi:hypothetical protein
LEQLLFDKQYKKRLLERSQLHRVLVNELWVFGEQYVLGLDDESLKTLLNSHLKLLGRKALAGNVRDINGENAIPDLMLSGRMS